MNFFANPTALRLHADKVQSIYHSHILKQGNSV